jgi:hypothetical protein
MRKLIFREKLQKTVWWKMYKRERGKSRHRCKRRAYGEMKGMLKASCKVTYGNVSGWQWIILLSAFWFLLHEPWGIPSSGLMMMLRSPLSLPPDYT